MKNLKKLVSVIVLAIFMFSSWNGIGQKQNSFDKIGIEHNQMLRKVLPKIDYSKKGINLLDEIKIKFIKEFPKRRSDFENFFSEIKTTQIFDNPFDLLKWMKEKNKINKELYDLVYNDLIKIKNMNSKEIQNYVINTKSKKANLSTDLQNKYYSFLSVLKYSSKFWSVDDENGVKYITKNNKWSPRVNGWKVLGCDAVGCFMGGPAGAAGSSAISIIMQL